MVRKASRLASVCRRLPRSDVAGLAFDIAGVSAAGSADALKIEVVIPHRAKDWTDLRLATRGATESDRYTIMTGVRGEIESSLLPVVRSGWQGFRRRQHVSVHRVANSQDRCTDSDQTFSARVVFEPILSARFDGQRLR